MKQDPPRKTGRPLSFDRDAALKQAMLAFWRHGYETTSVSDLTAAMGVSAPSLYAAFGDKRRLFLEAVQLYAGPPDVLARQLDAAVTARQAASEMLTAAAVAFTGDQTPPGCLLASATASGSADAAPVQAAVTAVRDDIRDLLQARINRDVAAGLLPQNTDTAALAALVVGLIQGLSVLARDGVPRAALLQICVTAMQAWPDQVLNRTELVGSAMA